MNYNGKNGAIISKNYLCWIQFNKFSKVHFDIFYFFIHLFVLEPFDDELVVEPELTSEQISLRYWLQTINADNLPCPLCTRENSRRFDVQKLRVWIFFDSHDYKL